jgi:hypothetical protein
MPNRETRYATTPWPPDEGGHVEKNTEVLAFYEQLRVDGELILGGSGFNLRLDRSLPAVMAFAHETRTVLINPDAIELKGLNAAEKRYVFGHEIAHFVQMARDPDSYLHTFELAEERASQAPEEMQDHVKRAWGRFYNVFLDINDNAIVDRRSMWTQRLSDTKHPRDSLYRHKMTQENMSGGAKAEQFLFGVLRRAMLGPEAALTLDPDVQQELEKPYTYLGRRYASFFDFARRKFFDPELSPATLLSALERTACPLFERFLQDDLASGKIKEPLKQPVDLEGNDLDAEQAKKIVKGIKEANKSGKERAQDKATADFKERMAGRGFSAAQIKRMLEIQERTNDVYQTIVDFWGLFLQVAKVAELVEQKGFRSGHQVEVDEFIRQIPQLETQPDQLKLFSRRFIEPMQESFRPKSIELHLVLDLSGSMDTDKRKATQEAAYALARSLIQFRRNQHALAQESDPLMEINLNLIGFGSSHQELFERFPDETTSGTVRDEDTSELDIRLWRAILAIGSKDLGGTVDAPALQAVEKEVSRPDRAEARERGDRVAVLFEITDGETETVGDSASVVTKLNKMPGVYARGIQIPGLLHADASPLPRRGAGDEEFRPPEVVNPSGAFEAVWGNQGRRLDRLEQLRPILLQLLFEALKQRAEEEKKM